MGTTAPGKLTPSPPLRPRRDSADLGVNSPDLIGDQFFNELRKREIGRQKCLEQGCTHFMAMDTDEFYIQVGCVWRGWCR